MFDPEPAREILARVIDGTTSTVDAALKIADHYGLALDTVGPIVAEVANNDAGLDIDWAVDSVRGSVEVSQLLPPPSSLEATAAAAVEHDEPEPPRWAPRPPQPPDIVADLLRRAALDPDLPDGAFVQLSRALREEAVTALSKAKTDPVLVALDHVLTRINQLDNPYAAVSLEWHQEWEDGRQAAANAVADAIIAHVNRLAKAVGS